ncbi:MAG: hypothetical protein AUJ19_03710 [Parcubacteria group bacterium CG1_02_58_44]|nr:MAG: hypothetical protein AUJ19_03710 [Parcubacteria group bacterium CG1_02_58_44]
MTMRYAHVAPASLHEAVLALPSFEGIPKTFGQQAVNTAEKPSLNAENTENIEALIFPRLSTKTRLREETCCW